MRVRHMQETSGKCFLRMCRALGAKHCRHHKVPMGGFGCPRLPDVARCPEKCRKVPSSAV